jgi:LCP family protein required for cell wall assembly
MRVSGFLLGIIGFVALIAFTGVCAVFSYSITRDTAIDMWESGSKVESISEVVQAVFNPQDFEALPTATPGQVELVIPSITPISTVAPTQNGDSMVVGAQASPTLSIPAIPTDQFAAERWGDPREINILLLGIDERVGFTGDESHFTDTMMVLHIDPVRKMAGVISFPRDLWVNLPGYNESARLNQANYVGDQQAYPQGAGPGLLMETLNQNFGLRIDYYVMINFTVFETTINRLAPDGIEICIREHILDETYPDAGFGFMKVEFQPGCQRLDGTKLLQYARTRKTQGGDLDRSQRQQEVMEATRNYILSAGGIQNFITQIGPLWNELSGSYRTNLALNQITSLALLMNDIQAINYSRIGAGYITPITLNDGRQVLLPSNSAIQNLIQQTFYPGVTLTLAEYRTRAEAENAAIHIYNNTNIVGLASNTREFLLGYPLQIVEVWNMPEITNQPTMIRDYGGGRNTALFLAALFGLPTTRIERGIDGLAANGVAIVVGPDMQEIISGGGAGD